jgi:hypothetical protein
VRAKVRGDCGDDEKRNGERMRDCRMRKASVCARRVASGARVRVLAGEPIGARERIVSGERARGERATVAIERRGGEEFENAARASDRKRDRIRCVARVETGRERGGEREGRVNRIRIDARENLRDGFASVTRRGRGESSVRVGFDSGFGPERANRLESVRLSIPVFGSVARGPFGPVER